MADPRQEVCANGAGGDGVAVLIDDAELLRDRRTGCHEERTRGEPALVSELVSTRSSCCARQAEVVRAKSVARVVFMCRLPIEHIALTRMDGATLGDGTIADPAVVELDVELPKSMYRMQR